MSAPCDACPLEVRGLYATAHNAVLAFEAAMKGDGDASRAIRKMRELKDAVEVFRPIVEAHFAECHPSNSFGPKSGHTVRLS